MRACQWLPATRRRVAQRFKDAPAMLVPFHRSGGLATASRATPGRSGTTERITRLYCQLKALLRAARSRASAIADTVAGPFLFQTMTEARAAGLAIACRTPRHPIGQAQR